MSTLTITDSSEPTLSSKKAQILQIANHQKWHIIRVNKCKKGKYKTQNWVIFDQTSDKSKIGNIFDIGKQINVVLSSFVYSYCY